MKKEESKPEMSVVKYLFEALIIVMVIIPAVLICIYLDDQMMKKDINILNKYDSITAKLPVQEKLVFFNDKPKRTYRDQFGILNVEF